MARTAAWARPEEAPVEVPAVGAGDTEQWRALLPHFSEQSPPTGQLPDIAAMAMAGGGSSYHQREYMVGGLDGYAMARALEVPSPSLAEVGSQPFPMSPEEAAALGAAFGRVHAAWLWQQQWAATASAAVHGSVQPAREQAAGSWPDTVEGSSPWSEWGSRPTWPLWSGPQPSQVTMATSAPIQTCLSRNGAVPAATEGVCLRLSDEFAGPAIPSDPRPQQPEQAEPSPFKEGDEVAKDIVSAVQDFLNGADLDDGSDSKKSDTEGPPQDVASIEDSASVEEGRPLAEGQDLAEVLLQLTHQFPQGARLLATKQHLRSRCVSEKLGEAVWHCTSLGSVFDSRKASKLFPPEDEPGPSKAIHRPRKHQGSGQGATPMADAF